MGKGCHGCWQVLRWGYFHSALTIHSWQGDRLMIKIKRVGYIVGARPDVYDCATIDCQDVCNLAQSFQRLLRWAMYAMPAGSSLIDLSTAVQGPMAEMVMSHHHPSNLPSGTRETIEALQHQSWFKTIKALYRIVILSQKQ